MTRASDAGRDDLCVVCREPVPGGRLPLACDSCGGALHPACAARVERGPAWRDRRIVCRDCSGASPAVEEAGGVNG